MTLNCISTWFVRLLCRHIIVPRVVHRVTWRARTLSYLRWAMWRHKGVQTCCHGNSKMIKNCVAWPNAQWLFEDQVRTMAAGYCCGESKQHARVQQWVKWWTNISNNNYRFLDKHIWNVVLWGFVGRSSVPYIRRVMRTSVGMNMRSLSMHTQCRLSAISLMYTWDEDEVTC